MNWDNIDDSLLTMLESNTLPMPLSLKNGFNGL